MSLTCPNTPNTRYRQGVLLGSEFRRISDDCRSV
nr:MAG TPA: hypothetical protein [Caudoviricetes sp.]